MPINSILKDKKILVIGASGFVGRNLYYNLLNNGIDVIGTYCSNKKESLIHCDCTDLSKVRETISGIDYVFMLAAKTYGANVMKNNPTSLVTDTIIMNANVLQACYEEKVEKVFYLSSSTVYQEAYHPIEESELDLNKEPFDLYKGVGWVKRYTEKLCEFYNSLGLNIVIARPTNIYGPGDKYNEGSHFIPAVIKRAIECDGNLVIWGRGNSIKNIIYIDDLIKDIITLTVNHNSVEPINICSDSNLTIRTIVSCIVDIVNNHRIKEIIYDYSKPESIPYRVISKNKFESLYGKSIDTMPKDGLKNTVEWIKNDIVVNNKF
jgi:GDP-L-fucose synthase